MSNAFDKVTQLVTGPISAVVDYREVTTEQKYPLGTRFSGQVVRNLITETNIGPIVITYVRADVDIPIDSTGNNDSRIVGASLNKATPGYTQDEVNDMNSIVNILEYTVGGNNTLVGALMFEGYIKDGIPLSTINSGDHFFVISRGTMLVKNGATPPSSGSDVTFDSDGKIVGSTPGGPMFGQAKVPGPANGLSTIYADFIAPPRVV